MKKEDENKKPGARKPLFPELPVVLELSVDQARELHHLLHSKEVKEAVTTGIRTPWSLNVKLPVSNEHITYIAETLDSLIPKTEKQIDIGKELIAKSAVVDGLLTEILEGLKLLPRYEEECKCDNPHPFAYVDEDGGDYVPVICLMCGGYVEGGMDNA